MQALELEIKPHLGTEDMEQTTEKVEVDEKASGILLKLLRRNRSEDSVGVEFTVPLGMIYVGDLERHQQKIQQTKVIKKDEEEASTVLLEVLRRNQSKAGYGVEFNPPLGMTYVGHLEKQQLQETDEPTTTVREMRLRSTEEQKTPTMACNGVKNCPPIGMIPVLELDNQQLLTGPSKLRTDCRRAEETRVHQIPQMGDQSTKVKIDFEASESNTKPDISEMCVPFPENKQLGTGLKEKQRANKSNVDNKTFAVLRERHPGERKEPSKDFQAERKRDYIIRQLQLLLVDQNKIITNREIVIFTQRNEDISTLDRAHKKAIVVEPLRKYKQIQEAFRKLDERLALCQAREREVYIEMGSVVYYILKGLERRHQHLQKKKVDLLKDFSEINRTIRVKQTSDEGFKDKMVAVEKRDKETQKKAKKISLWKRFCRLFE